MIKAGFSGSGSESDGHCSSNSDRVIEVESRARQRNTRCYSLDNSVETLLGYISSHVKTEKNYREGTDGSYVVLDIITLQRRADDVITEEEKDG